MKKFLSVLMATCILLTPSASFAEVANKPNEAIQENVEIRNQNIYVPTKDGVQRATYEEAVKIDKYNKMPLNQITTSYLLGDYDSGKILEGNNIDEVHAMASTSKLVGVFVVMDKLKDGSINKDDIVTIDKNCASLTGSSYKLKEDDKVKVENLLRAALIISGNDAITALGNHVAGSKENFVIMMNKKCKDLGLTNAHMVNATGLTDYSIEDYNKMTTREMFILTRELLKEHPDVLEYTKETSIDKAHTGYIEHNTNPLLGVLPEVDGLKTGYTNAAGRCLIATGKKSGAEDESSKDIRLIGITTGSQGDWQRYSASRRIMEDGFSTYANERIVTPDEILDKIYIDGASKDELNIGVEKSCYVLKSKNDDIETSISLKEDLKAPLNKGTIVGDITYYVNGEKVSKKNLVLKEKAYEKGFIFKVQNLCENIFSNIREVA